MLFKINLLIFIAFDNKTFYFIKKKLKFYKTKREGIFENFYLKLEKL